MEIAKHGHAQQWKAYRNPDPELRELEMLFVKLCSPPISQASSIKATRRLEIPPSTLLDTTTVDTGTDITLTKITKRGKHQDGAVAAVDGAKRRREKSRLDITGEESKNKKKTRSRENRSQSKSSHGSKLPKIICIPPPLFKANTANIPLTPTDYKHHDAELTHTPPPPFKVNATPPPQFTSPSKRTTPPPAYRSRSTTPSTASTPTRTRSMKLLELKSESYKHSIVSYSPTMLSSLAPESVVSPPERYEFRPFYKHPNSHKLIPDSELDTDEEEEAMEALEKLLVDYKDVLEPEEGAPTLKLDRLVLPRETQETIKSPLSMLAGLVGGMKGAIGSAVSSRSSVGRRSGKYSQRRERGT